MADTPEQARVRADVAAAVLGGGIAVVDVDEGATAQFDCPFVHAGSHTECQHPAVSGVDVGRPCEFDTFSSEPRGPCPLRQLAVFVRLRRVP